MHGEGMERLKLFICFLYLPCFIKAHIERFCDTLKNRYWHWDKKKEKDNHVRVTYISDK